MRTWKVWLLVALIFFTGAVAGGFGMRAYLFRHLPELLARPAGGLEEHVLGLIDAEVGLSETQKAAIRPIIKEGVTRAGKVQEAVRAQMEANFAQMDEAISAKLDAGQKEKFAVLRARMEQFRRAMPPGPPSGGPPPGPPPGVMPFGPPPGPASGNIPPPPR